MNEELSRSEDARIQLLRAIDANPRITQRALAEQLGVSVGKVNYLLRALAAVGMVKAHNFRRSGNKVGYAYLLTPQGFIEKARLTQAFLARKLMEYDALRTEIEALQGELQQEAGPDRDHRGDAEVRYAGNI